MRPPELPIVCNWCRSALQELTIVSHDRHVCLGVWRALGYLPDDALNHLACLTLRLSSGRYDTVWLSPGVSVLPRPIRNATSLKRLTLCQATLS